jgi:hypothetical protein
LRPVVSLLHWSDSSKMLRRDRTPAQAEETGAASHGQTIFWLRRRERHTIAYEPSFWSCPGVGAFDQFRERGPEMVQAGGCVSLPQFIENSGVTLARGAAVLAAGILVSVLGGPSANAQYRGTPEMQQACTPDVMRLCNAEIPDVGRITACMKRNRMNLSPACGTVFGVGVNRHQPHRR